MKLKNTLLVGALIASGFGCASRATTKVDTAVGNLAAYKSVSIHVTSDNAENAKEADALGKLLVSQTRDKKIFVTVVDTTATPDTKADVNLTVSVTEVRRVSEAKRAMMGAMAGRSGMTAKVLLTESKTSKKLGEATVKGESSGGSIVAGTTDEAVAKTADEIVAMLQGHKS